MVTLSLFKNGDVIAGQQHNETLAHGLIAVAELNGWRCEGHQSFRNVGHQLQTSSQRQRWRSDVAAGEQVRKHFYQAHLIETVIQRCRAATAQGMRALHTMLQ